MNLFTAVTELTVTFLHYIVSELTESVSVNVSLWGP